jgi:dolichol-phosphate mannosyltransferase
MVLSVVVPVYGCGDCLEELHEQIVKFVGPITSEFEIVFVDDRSPDHAWPVLERLVAADSHVRAIRLSRNFGQHAAITAGLAASRGEWTVVMDCDLQDPPDAIPSLYARANEGFDLVLARRRQRTHSPVRLALARVYFKLLNTFMGTDIDGAYGTFSILSRKVVDAYLSLGDRDRHYLFVLYWLGFEHGTIEVEHRERGAGQSSYTLGRLLRHAVSGVFFQTTNLLLYIVYLGFIVAGVGLLGVLWLVYQYVFAHPPAGFTSLAVLILVVGGFIIGSTGVTGLYIGRVFQQVKGRPLYIIDVVAQAGATRRALGKKAPQQEVESVR